MYKIVSDTHFNHDKIFKERGFSSCKEMDNKIIQAWNKNIDINDKVIHLGDFAFGDDFEYIENIIKKLNGKITLILGNHDTSAKIKLYTKYFKCLGSLEKGEYWFSHEPIHPTMFEKDRSRQLKYNYHGHLHFREILDKRYRNCNMDLYGLRWMVTELDLKEEK